MLNTTGGPNLPADRSVQVTNNRGEMAIYHRWHMTLATMIDTLQTADDGKEPYSVTNRTWFLQTLYNPVCPESPVNQTKNLSRNAENHQIDNSQFPHMLPGDVSLSSTEAIQPELTNAPVSKP